MFKLTEEDIEEMVNCILDCGLDYDEAFEYAVQMAEEATEVNDGN